MAETVNMKKTSKKGKVHYTKTKSTGNNPPLEKMSGCRGCKKVCQFNNLIATPDAASDGINVDYPCKKGE